MSSTIILTQYTCDYCKKKFNTKRACDDHEKFEHKCLQCEHNYIVYGCESNCELLNENKRCKFKAKEK